MLQIDNLSVTYGLHRALDNVSLQVVPGEVVVMLGSNGAGKSSLLRAIAGVSAGKVAGGARLGDIDVRSLAAHQVVDHGIALVPEGRGVFGDLTVIENLHLGAYAARARGQQAENLARVHSLFPKLIERKSQIVRTMSGGEQQMVAIGRALMSNPQILMLDEPSLGLSPLLCKELFTNIARIRDSDLGVLLVEQNAKQSLAIADRGYLIENGTITAQATAQALLNDTSVQDAYLGGALSNPPNQKGTTHA